MPALDSLLDRLRELRNRGVADPRFQRLAQSVPGARWIARRHARRLFDLCAGFVYSQVLLACVQLRVFEHLRGAPRSPAELAPRLALGLDATIRLLEAARALGLTEARAGDRYGLSLLGAALLANPGIAAMVEHHPVLYGDLADPVSLLRGEGPPTALSRYWPYAGSAAPRSLGASDVAPYSALMGASVSLLVDQVLAAVSLHRHRTWLDVGGGEGALLAAIAARAPHLRLVLFDLPSVAERAAARFRALGLAERASAIGGDLFSTPLPRGADLVSLVRVLHDHDDDRVLYALRAVREAIAPEGTLLIAEPMAATPGAEPIGAYFALYLLAMGRGRPRAARELTRLLETAGFTDVRLVATPIPLAARVLLARPGPTAAERVPSAREASAAQRSEVSSRPSGGSARRSSRSV